MYNPFVIQSIKIIYDCIVQGEEKFSFVLTSRHETFPYLCGVVKENLSNFFLGCYNLMAKIRYCVNRKEDNDTIIQQMHQLQRQCS